MAERLERSEAAVEGRSTDRIKQQVDALAARHLERGGNEIALVSVYNPAGAQLQWSALLSCCADRADDPCSGLDRMMGETELHSTAGSTEQQGPPLQVAAHYLLHEICR